MLGDKGWGTVDIKLDSVLGSVVGVVTYAVNRNQIESNH